jgi:hypothetical protein
MQWLKDGGKHGRLLRGRDRCQQSRAGPGMASGGAGCDYTGKEHA